MFRLQNNVPSTYIEQSRDFQLFCRLYDCINNGVQFDISTITDILDPIKVNDRVVKLLATRVGFITDIDIDNTVLRYILSAYPYIIKNKGTRKGIEAAVNAILHAEHSIKAATVEIVNKPAEGSNQAGYSVNIYTPIILSSKTKKALNELLKYILPVGYVFDILPYDKLSGNEPLKTDLTLTTANIIAVQGPLTTTSSVRGSNSQYKTYVKSPDGKDVEVSNTISSNPDINRLVNNFDTIEVISSEQYRAATEASSDYRVTHVTENGFHKYKENDQTEG